MSSSAERAVAIVGLGAILPDAPDAGTFWKNILNRRYSITETPGDRWSIADYYDPDPYTPDKTYSKIGGWVKDFQFDWKHYRIPPKVAAAMDISQQWAVTVAEQTLADYGYPERPLDTDSTAVILGTAMGGELHYRTQMRIAFPEYANALGKLDEFNRLPEAERNAILDRWHKEIETLFPPITEDSMPGELANIVAGRVANVFNLRGPNFITDAACAASLAAVETAVELLVKREANAVLTGGVDRNMGAFAFVKFCKIGALSPTGSRPFAEGADGFVMGEGAGMLLLKRLEDAERDGDRIYAVIRGVGGSSDGKGKGIYAPNPVGQRLAVSRAWHDADLDPATCTLIEAHGTSTRVGDLTEAESLCASFGGASRNSIGLGSVKSNIGHLKSGAGAAGLLKAALSIHHKIQPPTLNAERPNPNIDFANSPFHLLQEGREWIRRKGVPLRCGVCANGFGGTNFHVVLEEYIPGALSQKRMFSGMAVQPGISGGSGYGDPAGQPSALAAGNGGASVRTDPETARRPLKPLRGILALGAEEPGALRDKLAQALQQVEAGWTPPLELPKREELSAPERLVIDFGERAELLDRLTKTLKAFEHESPQLWKSMQAQGVFRGRGPQPGKLVFLFTGQGSQYLNMGRQLREISPLVKEQFQEADRVIESILGRPLTEYIFVDSDAPQVLAQGEANLMQTAICQPAVLTLDIALYRMLEAYGFRPELVMGHSLGEYAALIVSGTMRFADALTAAAARGREMAAVQVDDNGWMAAVMAPYAVIEEVLQGIDGYVVAANINSQNQCVIGGASQAVEAAIEAFQKKDFQAFRIPVSHAFHTRIVAPAAAPLRKVLDQLTILPPRLPMVTNVTGEFYPSEPEAIKDNLEKHIASPVQWMKGLETLYSAGGRMFLEVGPKKALRGLAEDVLGNRPGVGTLFTCHPKVGELPSFNQSLCGLYAAGYTGIEEEPAGAEPNGRGIVEIRSSDADGSYAKKELLSTPAPEVSFSASAQGGSPSGNGHAPLPGGNELAQVLAQSIQEALSPLAALLAQPGKNEAPKPYDRKLAPLGSVVISGTGLGLPGMEKSVMDPENALRILRGEQFVDQIPERFRKRMVGKRIVRIVKSEDGSGSFETINDQDNVIRLAGRPGYFDLAEEYGISEKLVKALDITTQLAMAAGLDALREAGIPLVQTYRKTTTGKNMPDRWALPEALRDETGVIFASAFPGGDELARELERYYEWENRVQQLELLEDLMAYTTDPGTLRELKRRVDALNHLMEQEPYEFDRNFLFRILAMGHSQFAEYIGARGPNTHVNGACAGTVQALAIAEDWIRTGRCRRVVVIAGDNATSDHLLEWIGAGFLALGAAATDDRVEEACIPFDRRRHGTIMGMGACAMVVESEDAVQERGMRAIVELLNAETRNSAFHPSRLDVDHIAQVMDDLITTAERRFGVNRLAMASQMVFMSHETYTPARGGSASAEVVALRKTFGAAADEVVVANTKGFTGHAMGVGVEDVISIKILEHGIVPPVPNYKVEDPTLGPLNLSRGWRYPVQFALHLAAGFGSQIAMTLIRRVPGGLDRIDDRLAYQRWLDAASGYDRAETEVVKRTLRVKASEAPVRAPAPTSWQAGTGPALRAPAYGAAEQPAIQPAHRQYVPPAASQGSSAAGVKGSSISAKAPAFSQEASRPEPVQAAAPVVKAGLEEVEAVTKSTSPQPARQAAVPAEAPIAGMAVQQEETRDPVAETVLDIVAQKTGYPKDMLELDLDLEADLGIDTVKQAETFLAIRETFEFERPEGMRLRDYPTLALVIDFVHQMRPDLASAKPGAKSAEAGSEGEPSVAAPAAASPVSADPVVDEVLQIVSEKTGYPVEMLELDLDLEADLGIDTVKQAETFLAIRETFEFERPEGMRLRDYPTLAHVVGFVHQMRPDLSGSSAEAVEESAARPAPTPTARNEGADSGPATPEPSRTDPVVDEVLQIVSEKTGYPVEMLELDLDLEADLGIDTVKQAETFLAIRETFEFERPEGMRLRDYPTLAHVVGFVHQMRPDLAAGQSPVDAAVVETETGIQQAEEQKEVLPPTQFTSPHFNLKDADQMPRRVPVPCLRPALEFCKTTGVEFGAGSRVVIAEDGSGVGEALAAKLKERGVAVLALEAGLDGETLEAAVQAWLDEGPILGVYWLPALAAEPALEELELEDWRELSRRRLKNLYRTMRTLTRAEETPGVFLISATRLGGLHGYGPQPASGPLGGAVTGFTKAYHQERPEALVKAVDFTPDGESPEAVSARLVEETLFDPGVVEVGYWSERRYGITLEESPAADGQPGLELTSESVFLVTGAAGGITSAVISDLAQASGGRFYLLDLIPEPAADDELVALSRQDKEALKQKLIQTAKETGEKLTPAKVDKRLLGIERQAALLSAIQAIQAAGGQACYYQADLLDGAAVEAALEGIRQREGRIDVLVHAAGIEISRGLAEKDPQQFDLVFGVKADGAFNLLKAARGMPLQALVLFSSVAGRFGNAGQTDYSAANDLLCKLASSLPNWRPETRAITIDWTAWSGAGMATRGSIPKIMAAAGIDMLPLEVGAPTVRRELVRGGTRGEVLVAGQLGILEAVKDETGGLDLQAAAGWSAGREDLPLVMVGEVKADRIHNGLEVETTLDPCVQPFLVDHALEGTPLLPGVMGMEAFAELALAAARLAHGAGEPAGGEPKTGVTAVQNVDFIRPFKFYRNQPQTLHLSVTGKPQEPGTLVFRANLRSLTQPAKKGLPVQEKVHFTGEVLLAEGITEAPQVEFPAQSAEWLVIPAEKIYQIYFHGPAYRVLESVRIAEDRAVGKLAAGLPPDTYPASAKTLIAPRLVELCFQAAGVWEIQTQGTMALPMRVDSLKIYRLPEELDSELYALVQAQNGGEWFDAQVVDEKGLVYLELSGYRTVKLPDPARF
jgi:acyl transferase domain-containing protein/NAD(P)-dependent dehydrogenase (short-subunit alcohol dehydrogenase family)/acyl carrier protein